MTGRFIRRIGQLHHPRGLSTGLVHTNDATTPHRFELITVKHLHPETAQTRHFHRNVGHPAGSQIRRWRIREISGQATSPSRNHAGVGTGLCSFRAGSATDQGQSAQGICVPRIILQAHITIGSKQHTLCHSLRRRGHIHTVVGGDLHEVRGEMSSR